MNLVTAEFRPHTVDLTSSYPVGRSGELDSALSEKADDAIYSKSQKVGA